VNKGLTKYLLFFLIFKIGQSCFAQTDSTKRQNPQIKFSGFIDVFYAYDFNQPQKESRQAFLYNHNRHNKLDVNLGFIKGAIEHNKYRANIALHTGTYANDNYASEPKLLQNIFEANIGLALNKKNNLWIDAGIFASHIGFESAISTDSWTLTRSLLAENSPYYLSGAKLTFKPNSKWELAALITNGWQRIRKVPGNSLPSLGTQVKFSPSEKTTWNWSTFIGTDDPDSTRRMRYFNNFFGQFQLNNKWGLIAGFDIGMQQRKHKSSQYDFWFSPVMILKYQLSETWATAFRTEYYQDQTGIIIPTNTTNGFKTTGLSLNIDFTPSRRLFYRLEGRWLNSKDKIFQQTNNLANNNLFIVTSIAIRLDR